MTHKDDRSAGREPAQPPDREGPTYEEVDEETLRRCVARDEQACTRLVTIYESRVKAFVKWMIHDKGGREQDFEDVAQKVFEQIFKHLADFEFGPRAKFSTWLFVITKNLSSDWARDRRRDYQKNQSYSRDPNLKPQTPRSADEMLEDKERETRQILALTVAWAKLSEEHQEVLKLFYVSGLPLKEIALKLNVPEGTVKSRLKRARESIEKDIKSIMEGHEDENKR